jgi:formate hydrogenlyase subunit 6/NADH:ubiquinone oxidoreductase subunit I/flavodoxin
MSIIRLLLGRRQFLFTFLSSALMLAFGRAARAFDLLFQTGPAEASEKTAAGEKKALKGIVVYYSASGNTAQVANAIYEGMKSVIACDVAPINKIKPADMAKYDVIAVGAPNWYMRVPVNFLIFTHDMPRMDGKHCIMFGTHGSGGPGMFWIMSRNILKRGMKIIGWSDWYGSDFMTPHSSYPDGEWGHPDSIDLAEAKAFGRRMAEYSIRIYGGESELLPDEIPAPDMGGKSLFSANATGGKLSFAGHVDNGSPRFDLTKCVYPKCTRCMGNCPVNAIDFSVIAPTGIILHRTPTASSVVLKEACLHCALCEKFCLYDAIAFVADSGNGERIFHKIDMKKCTYPKCTACIDTCPQNCLDFTKNPPLIHNWCENESLCYGVCPVNAITPTSTSVGPGGSGEMGRGQGPMAEGQGGRGEMGRGEGQMPGGPGGAGEGFQMPSGMMGGYSARFRNLLRKEDEGTAVRVQDMTRYPRVPVNKTLWPYHIEKG